MEITTPPKLASQFWPTFFKRSITLLIISQIIAYIIIGIILSLIISSSNLLVIWIIIAAFLIVNLIAIILIFITITKPTKDLLAAIIHISGEQPILELPNPNDENNKKTGLHDALQTIYSLSGSNSAISDTVKPVDSSDQPDLNQALNATTCGFVILDNKRKIIYANKSVPISIDNNGVKSLDLIFNGADTLDNWLDACNEHSVHNEHIWARIPDRLPNQEGRRFFDVIASYQKGAKSETVLSLIDRTSSYIVDEENLDFISFAAHELRGPITVIRGYLDVLEDELTDVLVDDQKELFHRLIVSSNRLTGYINNILNTSRYDRRHLKMRLNEETVAAIYGIIDDDMKLRASSQNRLLAIDFPSDLPTVAADRASMSEVFGNLIDNAIKYSNEGGAINITARVSGDFVEVSVTDHGIGMPESVINNLFQKFYRSYRSRETVIGTGIGLYISKAIVESHGGTISVRSEEGKGSTFTVSIPIYAKVADKLKSKDNSNEGLISEGKGWIKNHSMYRG